MFGVRADTMGFQKAKSVVWLLGLFGVLWVVAGWIALGASKQVILCGIALIVLAITLRILNNWREDVLLLHPPDVRRLRPAPHGGGPAAHARRQRGACRGDRGSRNHSVDCGSQLPQSAHAGARASGPCPVNAVHSLGCGGAAPVLG